jgi:hypothetical protein
LLRTELRGVGQWADALSIIESRTHDAREIAFIGGFPTVAPPPQGQQQKGGNGNKDQFFRFAFGEIAG